MIWLATMVALARVEMARAAASPDVEELIDEARIRKEHSTALYGIQFGAADVGRLRSTVSGGQREGQLLYTLQGEIGHPFPSTLKGFVRADWDRRPQRFVLEGTWGGERHRIEGSFEAAGEGHLLRGEYIPPVAADRRDGEWPLPELPVLAPGPLPLPALKLDDVTTRAGEAVDPATGKTVQWSLSEPVAETIQLAEGPTPATRHELSFPPFVATLWIDETGLPLKMELPLGLRVEIRERPHPPKPGDASP